MVIACLSAPGLTQSSVERRVGPPERHRHAVLSAMGDEGSVGERACGVSFLIRVVLPDKPGSLGAVATALGNAGADILGVTVVERSPGHAVDDLAVELPQGRPPDVLITAAESVPGVQVESVRPHSGLLETHRELELIEEITGDPGHALELLAAGVPRIFRAGWALVVVREGARSYRLAESPAAPDTIAGDLPWLPLSKAIVVDPEVNWVPEPWSSLDTELAAAPFGAAAQALVVGRPGGPVFRPSELARLAHLAGIVTTVLAS
ncbi:MAG: hypothetical protein QOG20_2443 [Pseudonocardiales bacterium]|nr:Amino acid-binding protein [Pseudonocardia sp.]MDT7616237.1 hypothetical protein [Pseudonocardiales bacterium]MDT7706836.1 hypothetical protein [Pseudonocardiales bacterium]